MIRFYILSGVENVLKRKYGFRYNSFWREYVYIWNMNGTYRNISFRDGGDKVFSEINFDEEGRLFFDSFFIRGNENDIFCMENIPHIVNAAGLCICLEGSADVVIGSQSYRLRKGDMCSVLPRTILYAIRKSEDFKGYACVCTPQFLMSFNIPLGTPLYLFVRDNPCISLGEQECGWLLKMCRLLEEHAARKEHPCGMDISRLLASAVVYEVIGIYRKGNVIEQQPFSRKSKYYAEFVRLLTANYAQHRSVEFYADRLCITPRYLSAICKELTGMTATESINNHVMVNARILLASTDMSVLQISEELNFPNPSFFSQFFKRHEGVVPKTYRAMHRYEVGSDV
ncbi:hypothetical protein LG35_09475 [Alistipes inops]|uniref:HTH araC/xylS-type domain-containing protein n=2 Tax=Bacteroidales TaxID=171549 RepID=A0ABR4YH27_9BACT|nr:hypothetical protein LG35_09475 [Alistipes inops]HAD55990.1 hypothetical protein [Alistipes sp.]